MNGPNRRRWKRQFSKLTRDEARAIFRGETVALDVPIEAYPWGGTAKMQELWKACRWNDPA